MGDNGLQMVSVVLGGTAVAGYAGKYQSDGTVIVTSALGEDFDGVFAAGGSSGDTVPFILRANRCEVVAGEAITAGDELTVGTDGRMKKRLTDQESMLGLALVTAGAAGEIIPCNWRRKAQFKGRLLTFDLALKSITAALAAQFTPGYRGRIDSIQALVTEKVTTGSKLATLQPSIGSTDVTGGALALTSSNMGTLGTNLDGSAITAANVFGATDAVKLTGSSVTAFAEGAAKIVMKIS